MDDLAGEDLDERNARTVVDRLRAIEAAERVVGRKRVRLFFLSCSLDLILN